MQHFRQTLHQPQLLLATLILTGILSLSAGVTKAQGTTANPSENLLIAGKSQHNGANLPSPIANLVLKTASQRTGLPTSSLRITDSREIQGSSSCLGISPPPGEFCTADLAPLWQVTVTGGLQRLVYHTSADGANIQLNQTASWNIKLLAASSLLMIVPLFAFCAYRARVREEISRS
jgi:hypothetical protein